jgi:hypothetical protein
VADRQRKKGAHHWQRQANPMRAAKRVRHFQAEYERKLRHIERHNAAHARWGQAKVGTPRAGRLG